MSDGAAATEEGTATETIPAMVLAAAGEREGSALRYRADEEWTELSYEDLGTRMREIACGLIAPTRAARPMRSPSSRSATSDNRSTD